MKKRLLIAISALSFSIMGYAQIDTLGFDIYSASTPGQILTDKISGLRTDVNNEVVGSPVNLYLRGTNSIHGDSQPLWVIDGVLVDASTNSISWLNPEDIESITVLKDLSATAMYGALGANGVIIVKTSISKSDKPFAVRWNTNMGINPKFSHNHNLSVSGLAGKTVYGVSGFFRQNTGSNAGNMVREGGARVSFETPGNKFFQFGSTTNIGLGRVDDKPSYDNERLTKGGGTSLYVLCNILPQLKFRLDGGLDLRGLTEYLWYGNDTEIGKAKNGQASIFGTSLFKYNAQALLTYKAYIKTNHMLAASGSFDINSTDTKYSGMTGNDFFSHNLGAKGITLAESVSDLTKRDHIHLLIGGNFNFTYAYKNIVGASAHLRLDRTPRYDDKARMSKSGNLFFNVRNLFFPKAKAVSELELRAGYGEAGKENVVPFSAGDVNTDPFYEGLCRAFSAEFNAGIKLGFASNRVLLGAKYYDKHSLDSFHGYCFGKKGEVYWEYAPRTEVYSSTSLLSNRGFEFDLNTEIIRTKNFSWKLNGNAAWNVNQALRVDPNDKSIAVLGQSVTSNVGFKLDSNGKPLDITGDGIIDKYDMAVLGDTVPSVIGGLGTSFTIGRLSLDVLTGAAAGYYFRVDRVSAGYSFPFKEKSFIKGLQFRVNVFPGWKSAIAGVGLDF